MGFFFREDGVEYPNPRLPVLFADTLITVTDDNQNGPVVRNNFRPISSSILSERSGAKVLLARKLYVLSERTAVACSGGVRNLKRFLDDASRNVREYEKDGRPAKALGDFANFLNNEHSDPDDRIHVIAAYSGPNESGQLHNNFTFGDGRFSEMLTANYELSGRCVTRGSGAKTLLELVGRHEAKLEQLALEQFNYEFALSLQGYLNSESFVHEIAHEASEPRTFGALFEHCFFDIRKSRWSYGPSYIVLSVNAVFRRDQILEYGYSQCIGYDPSGEILSIGCNEHGEQITHRWSLENLTAGHRKENCTSVDWRSWKPERALLHVNFLVEEVAGNGRKIYKQMSHVSKTTDKRESNGIQFHFNQVFVYRISESTVRETLKFLVDKQNIRPIGLHFQGYLVTKSILI